MNPKLKEEFEGKTVGNSLNCCFVEIRMRRLSSLFVKQPAANYITQAKELYFCLYTALT